MVDVPFGLRRVPREQLWKVRSRLRPRRRFDSHCRGRIDWGHGAHPPPRPARMRVGSVVGWSLFCVGLLMLIAVAYNFLATRNPETIIAVDKNPIARGETLTIHVLQPGPIRLKSLRADVFGEELYVPMLRGDPDETRTTGDRRPLGTFKFSHATISRFGPVRVLEPLSRTTFRRIFSQAVRSATKRPPGPSRYGEAYETVSTFAIGLSSASREDSKMFRCATTQRQFSTPSAESRRSPQLQQIRISHRRRAG